MVDLPGVGQNLHDHPWIAVAFECLLDVTVSEAKARSISSLLEYFFFGTGYLTTNGLEAGAFLHSSINTRKAPDIQLNFISAPLTSNDIANLNLRPGFFTSLPEEGFNFLALNAHPYSRYTTSAAFVIVILTSIHLLNKGKYFFGIQRPSHTTNHQHELFRR